MNIDLTKYVVARWGGWFQEKDSFTPNELRLGGLRDGVTLAGPLCIRVSVRARNHFTVFGNSNLALQERDVFSYKLDIPPGQTWSYPAPRALVGFDPGSVASTGATTVATGAALATHSAGGSPNPAPPANVLGVNPAALDERDILWGANAGFGVAIRPCGPEQCADPGVPEPCRPVDPCAPKKKECGCSGGGGCGGGCGGDCGCQGHPDDVPCNFATGRGGPTGMFFPAACEPCAPGAFVGMPPTKGPSLLVPAARGGTVRTRYFNGMFITKEDLWTDQNNNRLKHALMNRAMGQGVVWGFDVGFDGESVCVLPGYGVDCCGNDIVVSSAYRVDAQMLLRDPAAAALLATGGAKRMNLLLEYYECPEEPRPVHGDPCGPEAARCEMSRIRETARLRLVPPIDIDDSGCIKDFLDEVKRLKGDPVTAPPLTSTPSPAVPAPAASPATAATPVVLTPETAPFEVVLSGSSPAREMKAPPVGTKSADLDFFQNSEMKIALKPFPGVTFGSATINQTAGPAVNVPGVVASGVEWKTTVGVPNGRVEWNVVDWTLKNTSGAVFKGVTLISIERDSNEREVRVHVEGSGEVTPAVAPPPVPQPVPPVRISCLTEACDPDQRQRFPVRIPWLHEDLVVPGQPADPKVMVLAILYAVTMSKIQATGPATSIEVARAQEEIAKDLNEKAWKLLYNVSDTQRPSLVDALKRLFQCWCKALLYTGPRCDPGCGPHGVVIGCAMVENGSLRMVDPWGGRRWVVHYPLLTHWGKQFGIAPPDALASKLFDLICCVAHTSPTLGTAQPAPSTGGASGVSPTGTSSSVVPLGGSMLVFDQPTNVPGHLASTGVAPERTVALDPMEFIARVVEAVSPRAGAAPAVGAGFVHYTVNGIPELNLVAPTVGAVAPARVAAAPPAQPLAGTPAATGGGDRLATLVRTTIASRRRNAAVPSLLRGFTETLTRGLLAALPVEAGNDTEREVRDTMGAAEVRTVAALLDRDPEGLHVDVMGRANAAGLAAVLAANEDRAASVADVVGDAVHKLASDGRVASRDDLRTPAVLKAFKKAISDGLAGALPVRTVGAEVDRVLGNGG